MLRETIENERYFIQYQYDGDLTTVWMQDLETRKHAKGNALRSLEDEYNKNLGAMLAYTRAFSRLLHKNEQYYVRRADALKRVNL